MEWQAVIELVRQAGNILLDQAALLNLVGENAS